MRRWATAVFLLTSLLAAGCGSSYPSASASNPYGHALSNISGLQFDSAQIGWLWGWSASGLYQVDVKALGNVKWAPVQTPTGLPDQQNDTQIIPFFLSPRVAWLAWIYSTGSHQDLHVEITHNGGISWSRFQTPIPLQLQDVDSVAFASKSQGWLLASSALSAGQISFTLFKTADEGRHWAVSATSANSLAGLHGDATLRFTSANRGWISGSNVSSIQDGTTKVFLEASRDSGNTWTAVSLPIPPALAHGFFTTSQPPTSRQGIVEETVNFSDSAKTYTAIYKSLDGGATWRLAGPLLSGAGSASFTSDKRGLVVLATTQKSKLFLSVDGGASWRAIATLKGYVASLYMETGQLGWIMSLSPSSNRISLLHTADGGATWRPIKRN